MKHLRSADRVVVAFPGDRTARMLLIGPHDDSDPGRNVYDLLYELAGVRPRPDARRTKPRCCDGTGAAPVVGSDVVDDLVARTRSLVRRRRRS